MKKIFLFVLVMVLVGISPVIIITVIRDHNNGSSGVACRSIFSTSDILFSCVQSLKI